jgi:predicted transcriptional regulator
MKAITIREPYATLIAKGLKKYEFRSWNTHYRGDIYIHAAKAMYKTTKDYDLKYRPGEIVAIVEIVDVIKLTPEIGKKIHDENPQVYRLNTDGYAWVLANAREIDNPKKINGKLSFWECEL